MMNNDAQHLSTILLPVERVHHAQYTRRIRDVIFLGEFLLRTNNCVALYKMVITLSLLSYCYLPLLRTYTA